MTIRELIERLEDCDPDAEVKLMTQPSWPFEYSVAGLAERSDFEEDNGPDDQEKRSNDVFLLEGRQICYGSKRAWDAQ